MNDRILGTEPPVSHAKHGSPGLRDSEPGPSGDHSYRVITGATVTVSGETAQMESADGRTIVGGSRESVEERAREEHREGVADMVVWGTVDPKGIDKRRKDNNDRLTGMGDLGDSMQKGIKQGLSDGAHALEGFFAPPKSPN